jgi:hypothetical protein
MGSEAPDLGAGPAARGAREMTLRWLSTMVGGRAVKSVRQKVAPKAQRELGDAIDADAVPVRRVVLRDVVLDEAGETAERTVIARVNTSTQPAMDLWLTGSGAPEVDVRTDWLFLPAVPEAILLAVAEDPTTGAPRFRFNLRLSADEYRRHLDQLSKTGRLGLTCVPLQIGEDRHLESPCAFVAVLQEPLREFLRMIPAAPVV